MSRAGDDAGLRMWGYQPLAGEGAARVSEGSQ
jgi:hypothetical protein